MDYVGLATRDFKTKSAAKEYFRAMLGNYSPGSRVTGRPKMRSVLLWLIGVPIPIILLLAFCTHHL